MKLVLEEQDLRDAVTAHIQTLNILKPTQEVQVEFTNEDDEVFAEIDISEIGAAPKTRRKRRTRSLSKSVKADDSEEESQPEPAEEASKEAEPVESEPTPEPEAAEAEAEEAETSAEPDDGAVRKSLFNK